MAEACYTKGSLYILVSLATCMFSSLFVQCARNCLRIALNCGSDGVGVGVGVGRGGGVCCRLLCGSFAK